MPLAQLVPEGCDTVGPCPAVTTVRKRMLVGEEGLSAHLDACAVQAGGSLAAADLLSAGPPLVQQLAPKLIF